LYGAGADLVINGHEHYYQRWSQMTPSGAVDSRGIREFIVGTGNYADAPFRTPEDSRVQSERNKDPGVLRLALHPTSYDWQFVDSAGVIVDSGSQPTHNQGSPPPPDSTPPTEPTGLSAPAVGSTQVSLTWTASTDNVTVAGYNIYRDGAKLTSVAASPTSYTDVALTPGTTYTYRVSAVDEAGNESDMSDPVTVTTSTAEAVLWFAPTDDTYIRQNAPRATAGAATRLVTDHSPVTDFLIKFNVTGIGGCTALGAKLRLTVGTSSDDNSDHGGDFHGTGTNWTEATATWRNAPAADATVVAGLGRVLRNTTYLVDVSALVKGDGPVAIRVSNISDDGVRYFSKEGSANLGPKLQVTCS
jgi:hypothetical protein